MAGDSEGVLLRLTVMDHDGPVNDSLVVHLGSIDKRLLEDPSQDDGVHGPLLPSQADRGRAPSINIDSGHSALERASMRSASWGLERP
jgi:hypothetical protein